MGASLATDPDAELEEAYAHTQIEKTDTTDALIKKAADLIKAEVEQHIDYRMNRRPGKLPHISDNAIDWRYIENRKSSVRCKVEHAFRIIKCQFGYKKTVYLRKLLYIIAKFSVILSV